MKTLEELGYEKFEEDECKAIYRRKDNRRIRIVVDKKKKEVFKRWAPTGDLLEIWKNIDEMKAIIALLEEKNEPGNRRNRKQGRKA